MGVNANQKVAHDSAAMAQVLRDFRDERVVGLPWDDLMVERVFAECAPFSSAMDHIHVGLDFFDASIKRIAAWVIGARNTKKAILKGLLHPARHVREAEREGDFTARLALTEDAKSLPWGAVWNEYCRREDRLCDGQWLAQVKADEDKRLVHRK